MDGISQDLPPHQANPLADAEACYRAVLVDVPALLAENRLAEAENLLVEVLSLYPDMAEAHGNLGVIFRYQGRLGESERHLRQALKSRPDYPEALNNLGAVLLDTGHLAEAEKCLRRAHALRPGYASAWNNLGNVLKAGNRIVKARHAYSEAIKIAPDYAEAHWNRALVYLLQGDFNNGWREYEWRLRRPDTRHLYPDFSTPAWQGENLGGRTILLYAEQGMGDTLQFVRFAPLVAARGGRVVLRCQPLLKRLLQSVAGVDAVVAEGEPLPHFDVHCALLSLPLWLGVDDERNIPADVPYLHAEPGLRERWAARLPAGGRMRVGLVWAGAPRPGDLDSNLIDRRRSLSLSAFAPLLDLPGIDFFSLQKGTAGLEAHGYPGKLIDLMDEVHDFTDTAALVSQLDLVISVDTSVAHLAGALGKPVWLLSRFDGCWRWMLERDDSPWYPNLRLFRQTVQGNWQPVIERVTEALRAYPVPGRVKPDSGPAIEEQVCAAMRSLETGRVDEARSALQKALEQAPGSALALYARGLVELKSGNTEQAIPWLEQSVAHDGASAEALATLGDAYRQVGRLDEAERCLGDALSLAPDYAEAHNNLGTLHLVRKQLQQAVAAFSSAIRFKPEMAMAHFNLGVAYRELNQLENAALAFQNAVAGRPEFAEAHASLGMAWLLMGRMREGFAEYEWRLRLKPPRHPGPQWDGLIVPGATLLVHFEQGYGDAIQFARYLPFIARQGMRVVVQCAPALQNLIRDMEAVTAVYGFEEQLPPFDAHCALLSLPSLFQTALDKIPVNVPYLNISVEKSAVWRERLACYAGTIKIGLCWQGNARHGADSERSIELLQFEQMAKMPGVTWISLQNRAPTAQEGGSAERLGLVDVSAQLANFTDTAALIGQLDLVVSVDTAVAHLAGALNRSVWTLVRYAPDWRWLLERDDSPWYPGMRLFRQREPGGWAEVVAEVDKTLRGVMDSLLNQPE
ncbi:hypothetical protein SKTS_18150 [Sulfurimicrobium lacus]|uniref:Uncharacterized protein n=1 Tax=Sulfurimicrobium lacus TaxID=2715678 RepID=A0A6F8VDW7_9PROT|nr:tetratricopeptide repeat protein [Sulfurimicrobium lacus]BCB26929.1 hypothetical protein SKTS_18150 [Sulfurimicrobium lacus]